VVGPRGLPQGTFSFRSQLGTWEFTMGPSGLTGACFVRTTQAPPLPDGTLREELEAYFGPGPRRFSTPVDPGGIGGFRGEVLRALPRIPPGHVISYGALAASLGRPGAARAAGAACRSNPVGLVVPCHRVVAVDGPGGYSGADPEWVALKLKLLELEGVSPEGGRFRPPALLSELPGESG
jgi:methylated-DNA-[protein]-cysteine S-methyltransferase